MKPLNLDQRVYDAVQQYPELIQIISDLGFPQVKNNFILRSFGKRLTLNQAISQSGLEYSDVTDLLISKGFNI